MKQFDLYEPTSVNEATSLLNQFGAGAKVVAGGSDLLGGVMKDWVQGKGMPYPAQIIDLTTIKELTGVKSGGDGFHIGANTTLTELIENQDLSSKVPLLTHAALSVASPLIRNFGTLGGNVNQRPRCWFFRGENFACYKKGGDFCYAVTGDNRYHAIIGGELCYIVHPSDTATALLALDASATVVGPGGTRTVKFDDYFHGPREDVLTENVLKANEVMTEVFIPTAAWAPSRPGTSSRIARSTTSRSSRWASPSRPTAAIGKTVASLLVVWRRSPTAQRSSRMRSRARTSRPPRSPRPRNCARSLAQ